MEAGREAGGAVRRIPVSDEYAEGIVIAKEIGRMVGGMDMIESGTEAGRQIGFSDMAILYRTHRQAEVIEKCLAEEGIPYIVAGREAYLDAESVTTALNYLRVCFNPADEPAMRALLKAWNGDEGLLQEKLSECAPKSAKEKPKRLLERWKKANAIRNDEAFDRLIAAAGAANDLASFLSDITLGAEGDVSRSGGKTYTAEAVRLMTLHGSKGLEFPVVFLAGIKRGVLPLETPYGRPTDMAEERRLLYVGMTRAKDELILLTHPEESAFLTEIPEENMRLEQAVYQRKTETAKQLSFL